MEVKRYMKMIIGADLVPTDVNFDLFTAGDVVSLVGEKLKKRLDEADVRIFNLELALTDKEAPIKKAGPNIGAPTSTVNGIKALGADLLGRSNNHVLDHGYGGFVSTTEILKNAGIAQVGAGYTKEEAKKPYYFEKDGVRVGVYACCEHEFSWVEDYGFGANGFDPLESLDDISDAKKHCDRLIVLYHGGKEHYAYPSPQLVKVCRKIVERGADLVLCQHTHCVGTEEDHKGGKIIYGQGNFIFNKNYGGVSTWGDGFLVQADVSKEGISYEYIPYRKTEKGIAYDESGDVLSGLRARSEEIKQPGFIEARFAELASETVADTYAKWILGHDVTEEELNDRLIVLFHYAECEVHRECLMTGLRVKGGLGKYGEFKELGKN